MTKVTPVNPAECQNCGKPFPSSYALKRHVCVATKSGRSVRCALGMLAVMFPLSLEACALPPQISANSTCFLHYNPPPINPFDSAGSYGDLRVPDYHCLLQIPLEIARGGTIEVAPNAFVDEAMTVQRGME